MQDNEIFKFNEALDRVDNDKELLVELFDMFFSEFDQALNTMKCAVQTGDAKSLEGTAHSQKSALGNIGAALASSIAKELEYMGRENNLSNAANSLSALEDAVAKFKSATEDFKKCC